LKVISNLHTYQIEGTTDFLHNLPLFQYLDRATLQGLATKSQYRKFQTNTLILRQEDSPTCIYFVKSGRLKVLRKVDFRIPTTRQEANDPEFLIQDPTIDDYNSKRVESKLLEVDELTNGDVFGDYAAILKEPIKFSVVAIIPAEVFIIDIGDFAHLGKSFAEAFL
jgi:CRP-like cAMP-binding protein